MIPGTESNHSVIQHDVTKVYYG